MPKEESKLERLIRLDKTVQNAGIKESLAVGLAGTLLFGVGLCFGLGALPGGLLGALPFGGVGLAVMLLAYPVYVGIFKRTKGKYVEEILQLTDELMRMGASAKETP